MKGEAETSRYGPLRREVLWFLELVAVAGLAVAQPTFDLLGKNAGLFVAWNLTVARAIAVVVVVVVVPALGAYAVEVLIGVVGPRTRTVTHLVLVAGGIGLVAMEAVKQATRLGPTALVGAGILAAVGAAVLVTRVPVARTWLRFLALAPVGFAVLLLVASPASDVIFESDPAFSSAPVARPHRVVMIVMDEFPTTSMLDGNGQIDAQLYPNLAALARTGTWYRNHTTVAPFTEAAVPAILTGQLPAKSAAVPVVADHPQNLVTLLGRTYDLNVRETVTRLCPRTACVPTSRPTGVRAGFRGTLADVGSIWWKFADPGNRAGPSFGGLGGEDTQAMVTAGRFVASLQPSARPRLDLLHVLLPHFPWHYLPTGQDYAALPGHTNGLHGQVWADDDVAALMRLRHLLQVQAADTFVGQVVARLRELGTYDDTLLVLTADHGIAFDGGKPIRGITRRTWPEIAWTPLFVKAPGQTVGGVDDRAAESVDVLPTVAAHLGVRIPWRVDGRSLVGPPRRTRTLPMFDWSRSPWKPPDGSDYFHLDRAEGFAVVMRARAAAPRDLADERIFAIGPFADLIGRAAAPPLTGAPVPGAAVLDGPLRYLLVNQASPRTPFVAIHGVTGALAAGVPLAVVVNGRVAGFSTTYRAPGSDHSEFWGTLVPRFFHNGRNLVQVETITGPPSAPVLHLLAPA